MKLYRHKLTFDSGSFNKLLIFATSPEPITSYAGGPPKFNIDGNKVVSVNTGDSGNFVCGWEEYYGGLIVYIKHIKDDGTIESQSIPTIESDTVTEL